MFSAFKHLLAQMNPQMMTGATPTAMPAPMPASPMSGAGMLGGGGGIAQAAAMLKQAPMLPGPQAPATPMQVPVQSQVLQTTPISQPQTQQGPAFLQQFGDGMMGVANPRAQFDASMYRRGGTPWQFGTNTLWAPQSTQQMAQNFAQGAMQPQGMPQLSDAQMQALAQMIAKAIRL